MNVPLHMATGRLVRRSAATALICTVLMATLAPTGAFAQEGPSAAPANAPAAIVGAVVPMPAAWVPGVHILGHRTPSATKAPQCRIGDVVTRLATPDGRLAVLDTTHRLPKGWKPPHLSWVNKSQQLQLDAASAWRKLRLKAAVSGITINIVSAYRTDGHQQTVFNRNVTKHGRAHALKYVARPGHSEHQLGLTVDIGLTVGSALRAEPTSGKPQTKAQRAANWLRDHAAEHGWVRSYPAGAVARTCYESEPWHWRYIGIAEAAKYKASGLTLREYLWRKR